MNVYDQAHMLARSLKETEEYKEFIRLKTLAYEDSTNKALLDEYKRLHSPQRYKVDLSQKLFDLKQDLLARRGQENG